MKILVTGKNGQLGRSIKKIVDAENDTRKQFVFIGKSELDFESSDAIDRYFEQNDFDVIVNCAAYTAVEEAEDHQVLANQVNHLAVRQMAKVAKDRGIKFIHISTDYVFDGEDDEYYTETGKPNPVNVYGQTKLDGECAVQSIMSNNAIIIRASWIYSEYGDNFVKIILGLGRERDRIRVVSDQVGAPTYATDLARVILSIINHDQNTKTQIYHYSNEGECSWYQFAQEILRLANVQCLVEPITTSEYSFKAKRPTNTLMSKSKIRSLGIDIPHWKDSLAHCVNLIV